MLSMVGLGNRQEKALDDHGAQPATIDLSHAVAEEPVEPAAADNDAEPVAADDHAAPTEAGIEAIERASDASDLGETRKAGEEHAEPATAEAVVH